MNTGPDSPLRPAEDRAGAGEIAAALAGALDHHRAGRLGEAEVGYRQVLALAPRHADALHLLGAAAHQRGDDAAAAELIGRSIALQPRSAYFHNDLGNSLAALGRVDEAEAAYREALRIDANFWQAHLNLAGLLLAGKRYDDVERCCRAALRLNPKVAGAFNTLGVALAGLGRQNEAEAAYREALRLDPAREDAHTNLGGLMHEAGRGSEAAAWLKRAVALAPDRAAGWTNLGAALHQQGSPDAAIDSLRRAIALDPDDAWAHTYLAFAHLALGQFAPGWREYEWRWQVEGHPRKRALPLWSGDPLAGRTILLYAEQGFGDTVQFARYARLVAAAGGTVTLEMPPELARLAASLEGPARIVVASDAEPDCALCCPLMSLPHLLGTTLDTIPSDVPYLAADPILAAAWRRRLNDLPGLRVGLVWAGGQRLEPGAAAVDRRRSIALANFAPLAAAPGVSLVSLQKGDPAAQTRSPPTGMTIHDWTDELDDFADTAALIAALDLVIAVDTAVVHLAGALAKPVWLLSRFDTCWRWLLGREDSPWYPTLRQFRQPQPGDWDTVIAAVRLALARYSSRERGGPE